MSESAQKTKKFPRRILELVTFIFIPYLIVYISNPVIFGILLFASISIFIFLYFRLTNYIINSENPGGHKKLNLPQAPKPEEKRTKNHCLKKFSLAILISITITQAFLLLGNINNYRETIINLPDNFSFSIKSQELSKIQSLQNIIFNQMLGVIFLICLIAWFFRKYIKLTLQNHILRVFVATVISGGILAFAIPSFLYNYRLIGETKDLTTALLGVTGGVVALFSLIKSHQKSELEREQLEVQKQKDNRDHIRQVHAARRDRYIEAVDKLSSKNASVRLGGVYALASLADEWLDDNNVDREIRVKEGQVIINNLCSYIRSPFPYAKEVEEYNARKELEDLEAKDSENLNSKEVERRNFLFKRFEDSTEYNEPENISEIQVKVLEEQEVRRTIFTEMSKRSGTLNTSRKKIVPGPWSKFEFNFSQAPIFYPLSNLTIENPNFSSSKFYGQADFSNTIFPQDQNFSNAIFEDTPILGKIKFAKTLNFSKAIFKREVNFNETIFEYKMKFDGAIFEDNLLILDTEFSRPATFKETVFKGGIHLNRAKFRSAVNFRRSKFKGVANFNFVLFEKNADFSESVFSYEQTPRTKEATGHLKFPSIIEKVKFYRANFVEEAIFKKTRFENGANFSGASFGKSLDFTDTYLGSTVFFSSGDKKATVAIFSANTVRDAYKFKQDFFSCKVDLGEATLLGETFEIPLGTVLFDPMSPKYKDGSYSGLSNPAVKKKKNPTHK